MQRMPCLTDRLLPPTADRIPTDDHRCPGLHLRMMEVNLCHGMIRPMGNSQVLPPVPHRTVRVRWTRKPEESDSHRGHGVAKCQGCFRRRWRRWRVGHWPKHCILKLSSCSRKAHAACVRSCCVRAYLCPDVAAEMEWGPAEAVSVGRFVCGCMDGSLIVFSVWRVTLFVLGPVCLVKRNLFSGTSSCDVLSSESPALGPAVHVRPVCVCVLLIATVLSSMFVRHAVFHRLGRASCCGCWLDDCLTETAATTYYVSRQNGWPELACTIGTGGRTGGGGRRQ